ncbi:MFS transporter [Streptomyces avermitilis]|uniref:Transmembrane efflux protein n=1 Tax=Streptomyces avermitilis (strain ATCC 31267 / DSM 46492 / JCM 5070 / NBRC 14893 / NCIMB 12804 / NRRL 8165 / MA-4680) TaxID=227882 RepID=Q82BQ8_STRAW|nr:MFS transporter [Streptomyces avermitilis]KUN50467.1 MFS transporter [Streptomyces avermitilis]MYT01222.1 MFS transporter [Streptomyces sp. SID5469]OOV31076.1 MFS transporter [Streptomyces avermitilis]BAC73358.1 putative transmembrane efflux protein [Streptomyces avermitilis MA-4680 = NBRC 14893]
MTETLTSPTTRSPVAPPVLGGLGLFTVLLGAALPLIDFFIVNVALPTIGRDLHASETVLELVVAGYGVSYAVLLVLGGRLGDLFGRREFFLGGMAAFGLTSLACGLAPSAWTLVAARVAQGAAAAAMLPQVLATIQSATEGPRRAKAMGLYGATAGLSMVAGQILGGVLVAADIAGTGWRSVFLVNVPVVVVGLFLAARAVPETRSQRPEPVDGPGTVLLAVSLLTLLVPLTEGRAAGWPLWTWPALAAFPFAAWAFYAVERRADRQGRTPLVPPSLFALTSLRRGLVMIVPFSIGFSGFMFVIAVALQRGAGLGPVPAGLALAPMAVVFFAVSLCGPRLVARYGTRVVTAGGLIQAVGVTLIVLAALRSWPDLGVLELLPGAAVAGAGQALQLPVLFRIILSEVPPTRAGVGGGVMITTQQSGLALGVATLGSLFLALVPGWGMRDALVTTLLVQLAGVALTTALSLRLPRSIS